MYSINFSKLCLISYADCILDEERRSILIASEMRWSMKNHKEKIKRKGERKLKISLFVSLKIFARLICLQLLIQLRHPTSPNIVSFANKLKWARAAGEASEARAPPLTETVYLCQSTSMPLLLPYTWQQRKCFCVLLKRTYVHERAPQEWEKFMACMLLFHAIHFMTLKHCKHDGEQHRAAHFSFPFSPKFYGIRNFIYAELTFCAFSELWRRRQLGRKIS